MSIFDNAVQNLKTWGRAGANIAGALPFDVTPGFNLSTTRGSGVPFVQRTGQTSKISQPGDKLRNSGGTNTAPSYSPYSAASAAVQQNPELVNKLFDARIAGFNSQLGTLSDQQDASEARIGNQFRTRMNDLDENLALGRRNLGMSRDNVNESRARSLNDIRDRLNSQSMGYANQLGAMGAGDSSATGLVNFALSGMASKNRGEVQRNASDQLTDIETQEETLGREYDRNKRDLDTWRRDTLSDLATEILQTKNAIKQAISEADAERAQQLAEYDESYTQQAVQALAHLEDTYASNAKALSNRYKSVLAPQTIKIDPALQKYAVKPIDAGELRSLEMPSYVNPESEAIAVMRRREEDEQNSLLQPPLI